MVLMQDGEAVGKWIKKSLDAGDDPKVIKSAMKKHSYDPQLVDAIMKSWVKKKASAGENNAEVHEFRNAELKGEIDAILSRRVPVLEQEPKSGGSAAEAVKKQGFGIRIPEFLKQGFSFPKITLPKPSLQSIKWILLALLAVLVIVAVSFALDWYADRMAARVVL